MPPQEQDGTDARLRLVERDIQEVLTTVRVIDQALRFPEQSPLGRELIGRSDRNAARIDKLDKEHEKLEDALVVFKTKFDELNGVVKALRIISALLGIAVAVITLLTFVNGTN